VKAKLAEAVTTTQPVRDTLGGYFQQNQQVPESLAAVGIPPQLANGARLALNPDDMVLTVTTAEGELVFSPSLDNHGRVVWACAGGEGLKPTQLPPNCPGGRQAGGR
ncbi:MAG TPA: pilin, partial [Rhodocyclaceae bacterium]|nr:pilin [Rhodocyclaceae bacterium]